MKSSSWFGQAVDRDHPRRCRRHPVAIVGTRAAPRRGRARSRHAEIRRCRRGGGAAGRPPRRPDAGRAHRADAKTLASTAGYWRGDYDKAIENPDAKLLAANAAYRKIRERRRLVAGGRRPHGFGRQAVRGDPSRESGQHRSRVQLRIRGAAARGDRGAEAAGAAGRCRERRTSRFTASPARRPKRRT